MKKQLSDTRMTFFDFTNFQYRINYEDLYEDWFIDVVFGHASAKLFRDQFIKKLSKNQKIGYIFASRDLRRRFKKAQMKYEVTMENRAKVFSTGAASMVPEVEVDKRTAW